MLEDRFVKRLRKKARKGLRGWPIATIAFYGPNLDQATKAAVGIVPSENAEVEELRVWIVDRGDIRDDPGRSGEPRGSRSSRPLTAVQTKMTARVEVGEQRNSNEMLTRAGVLPRA